MSSGSSFSLSVVDNYYKLLYTYCINAIKDNGMSVNVYTYICVCVRLLFCWLYYEYLYMETRVLTYIYLYVCDTFPDDFLRSLFTRLCDTRKLPFKKKFAEILFRQFLYISSWPKFIPCPPSFN